ncbi:hypothetical protein KUCAC02_023227 [Chaenocephalus aceratus]|uniref:Uncharacterized protein n=1 Tax=Chaenocephalus aceratus TaxID=36190 RepID=A0ACB9XQP4_CHAAC|nr:hypothetical protein KUCAC02_023227 [Chaenocephalus aceratus]
MCVEQQLTASGNSQSTSSCVPHLYRSKQLTTILSRLGHSETYDFSMELETAMAKAFDEMSTNLTPQIITGEGNTVFHSEWDNLKQNHHQRPWFRCGKQRRGNHDSRSEGEPCEYQEKDPSSL